MKRVAIIWLVALPLIVWSGWIFASGDRAALAAFTEQACALPNEWLLRIQRGYHPERSGDVTILPKHPAYMASGAGGTTHSGPWPHLQRVPLLFYGPGFVPEGREVDRPVTLADVAPTLARLLKGSFQSEDGRPLDEVARLSARLLLGPAPRLIVTVVWDGGGWNVLDQWPDAWPHLKSLMERGALFTEATVGSSPSVTPAVHTTLGTGVFPYVHGITDIPLRDEQGEVTDSFVDGDSSRFIATPTIAERWDSQSGNRALVGMVGYEPWHLGMIGQGSERPGGDRDDAVWLDTETNEWKSNESHYVLPESIVDTGGLEGDLDATDASDGEVDGTWRNRPMLNDPSRIEEVPGFITYHGRALTNLIESEGYGSDKTTDLLYTNFKQIDRLGHYFGMASPEVRDAVEESDRQLGNLVSLLDERIGSDRWVLVFTADHGQQPDAVDINAYGIDPDELENDIEQRFGPVVEAGWASQLFLSRDELEARGHTVEDVARYVGNYRLNNNTSRPDMFLFGAGRFDPRDRLFSLAIPSEMLPSISC